MKQLLSGVVVSLGILSSSVSAEVMVNVDGKEYKLSSLMENCQAMGDNPVAQIACFSAVSELLERQQEEPPAVSNVSVPEALEALRTAAQHEGDDTGLIVQGNNCDIHFLYYANYFRVSRRNVSSIDLFSAKFDASKIDYDRTAEAQRGKDLISRGIMETGTVSTTVGGVAIDSARFNFEPKSARMTIGDYALEVADNLTASESGEFDFVLVHPAKSQSSAEIWDAFKTYSEVCQG